MEQLGQLAAAAAARRGSEPPRAARPRALRWPGIRQLAISGVLLGACGFFLWFVDQSYPIRHWLFWRYAACWALAVVWSAACLAIGHVSLRAVCGRSLPLCEHLAVALPLGIFQFQLALFVSGLARLFGPVLFALLPLACLAIGGPSLVRYLRRARRHARALGAFQRRPTLLAGAALAFGVVCLVALYVPTMVPENASYDSRWRHLFLAEQYAVAHGVRRFADGFVFGASPHFSVLLYAWAFLVPRAPLFFRVELAAHVEFVVFLWTTLLGLPALVRRLVPRANPALVWTARFLFPGIAVYDSSLSLGADQIGAVLAVPSFLVGLRAWRGRDLRTAALLGAFAGAAVCAKETTALLLASVVIFVVVARFLLDAMSWLRTRGSVEPLWATCVAGASTLLFSAPHWLKNLIWYGDPLYPNLSTHFSARPWSSGAAYAFKWELLDHLWFPAPGLQGLKDALFTLVTFSFKPFTWGDMHHDWPVFGSLFTLLLLVLPFLRGAKRIWGLVIWVHLGLFCWFWGHHEERHLQCVVPWMAAVVAAIVILVWRSGGLPSRLAISLLVGAQLVWGADMYFYPSHTMLGTAPVQAVIGLVRTGFDAKYKERVKLGVTQRAIGEKTPVDAVLLVHESRDLLGYDRTVVLDYYGESAALPYETLDTPAKVYSALRDLGVTHLSWRDQHSENYAPLGSDIAFFDFAYREAKGRQRIEGNWLAEMPARAPEPRTSQRVAVLGCGSAGYASGEYELSDLAVPRFGPDRARFPAPRRELGSDADWAQRVLAIAANSDCSHELGWEVQRTFEAVARGKNAFYHDGYAIWVRRR